MSQASLPPRRPPRPRRPRPLTSLTFASSSSSACLALLIGVLAPLAARLSTFAPAFAAGAGLAPAALRSFGAGARVTVRVTFWRTSFFGAAGRAARPLSLRRLTTLAFFLAARTFFSFLRFWTIRPPCQRRENSAKSRTLHYRRPF